MGICLVVKNQFKILKQDYEQQDTRLINKLENVRVVCSWRPVWQAFDV